MRLPADKGGASDAAAALFFREHVFSGANVVVKSVCVAAKASGRLPPSLGGGAGLLALFVLNHGDGQQ